MSKSITNGSWSRIGDQALGFGLQRYTNGSGTSERVLWRLEITGHPNRKLVELDASVSDLRDIARWCEKAVEMLQSDGGRNVEEAAPQPAAA